MGADTLSSASVYSDRLWLRSSLDAEVGRPEAEAAAAAAAPFIMFMLLAVAIRAAPAAVAVPVVVEVVAGAPDPFRPLSLSMWPLLLLGLTA